MATHPRPLTRFARGPLHGVALALYFVLLPVVVATQWSRAAHESHGAEIRGLLVGLVVFWLVFLVQLVRDVQRVRHGASSGRGGSAWLAGLVVAALPFLVSPGPSPHAHRPPASITLSVARPADAGAAAHSPAHPDGGGLASLSAVPLALIAKRRGDLARRAQYEPGDEEEIDRTVALLREADPSLVARVRHLVGDDLDGVVRVRGADLGPVESDGSRPVVACVLRDDADGTLLAFAREGGRLRVDARWSDADVTERVVGLHDGGRVDVVSTEGDLLRFLAVRSLHRALVVFLGPDELLDDELRASCVTVESLALSGEATPGHPGPDPGALAAYVAVDRRGGGVRVELLRADPRVVGLAEPFTATLRRRCVEMVAYLALHRHEPVTGDRLRTRVLTRADVDASSRTLANTASAVRRSLGVDARGPRLHPVTSSGLYVTHALGSDVESFHALVARARAASGAEAGPLAERALSLVRGEPLASALRGFEWFLAEGHWARLQRDGEWAALALHHYALERDDVELAFWSLRQGRLLDPYSDALTDALARVPRLREFGGDRTGRAQHEPVGAGGAVVTGRARRRLRDEVGQ